jgi:hypothetical protein
LTSVDYTGARGCDRGCGEDLPENPGCTETADPAQRGGILRADTGGSAGDGHDGRRAGYQRGAGGSRGCGDASRGTGARGGRTGAAHATDSRRATCRDRTGAAHATDSRRATNSSGATCSHSAGAAHATSSGCATGSDRAASTQRRAEDRGLELARQRDRQNERERGALTPNLPLEGRAARAAVDVGACDAPGQDAATHRCQPLADLCARMLPRPPSTNEPLTCLEYQRLDFLLSDPEHGGDFLVRVIGELEQN